MEQCLLMTVTVLMLKNGGLEIRPVPITMMEHNAPMTQRVIASLRSDPVPVIDERTGDLIVGRVYECLYIVGKTSAP